MRNSPAYCLFLIFLSSWIFGLTQPPNIIIILTDDQGWGDLSIHGNSNLSTPRLDQLARSGARFDHFFVSPVCSPTRAELLTGRYASRGGVTGTSTGKERLDLDEQTIAEVFQAAGYSTAAYGKWHNGMQAPYHPNSRGFEDFYGFCSGHWGNYFSPMLEHNGELTSGNGYLIDDFTSHGLDFIEQNREKPFFLYLPYNTPHRPMQVPDQWWEKFENKELELRHRDADKEIEDHTRAALAMCENIDWNVGRILAKLDELELRENTIVVFFSDNGPNGWRWNAGMKGKKGSTDEGGLRSPLFISWQGKLEAGKKIDQISSVIDLFPTLIDLSGIEFEAGNPLDGLSLKPLLIEDQAEWKDRFVFSHWKGKSSVRSQQYRLDHQGRLFDMHKDPGQQQDISAEHPISEDRLRQALEIWEKEMLAEIAESENRRFPIGHPDLAYTQIPARDGVAHGNIQRSSPSPNCSFYTSWSDTADYINWQVEVWKEGWFEVEMLYSCPEADIGSRIELSLGDKKIEAKITQAHDPPLRGMEEDRYPRGNSYVKPWKKMKLGSIYLKQGPAELLLQATEIPGSGAMDFRLLMFKRK